MGAIFTILYVIWILACIYFIGDAARWLVGIDSFWVSAIAFFIVSIVSSLPFGSVVVSGFIFYYLAFVQDWNIFGAIAFAFPGVAFFVLSLSAGGVFGLFKTKYQKKLDMVSSKEFFASVIEDSCLDSCSKATAWCGWHIVVKAKPIADFICKEYSLDDNKRERILIELICCLTYFVHKEISVANLEPKSVISLAVGMIDQDVDNSEKNREITRQRDLFYYHVWENGRSVIEQASFGLVEVIKGKEVELLDLSANSEMIKILCILTSFKDQYIGLRTSISEVVNSVSEHCYTK